MSDLRTFLDDFEVMHSLLTFAPAPKRTVVRQAPKTKSKTKRAKARKAQRIARRKNR